MIGSGLMAVGGAFLTLCRPRQLHPGHHRGAWLGVHRAGHLRPLAHRRGVVGALIFACVYSLGLRLRIAVGLRRHSAGALLALPYLAVIAALALSGRNVAYPGAYLKPYRSDLMGDSTGGHRRMIRIPADRHRAGAASASPKAACPSEEPWSRTGSVLAAGHNRRVQLGSPIRHGETDALENAGRLPASVYARATMYTTLSPCDMCTGAILLYGSRAWSSARTGRSWAARTTCAPAGVEVVVLDDPDCNRLMQRVHRPLSRRSGTRTSARSDAGLAMARQRRRDHHRNPAHLILATRSAHPQLATLSAPTTGHTGRRTEGAPRSRSCAGTGCPPRWD